MENASKALIIAGAILLSILIISLGIMIYRNSTEAVDNDLLDDLSLTSFNEKIEQYCGANVRGATVNSLISTVNQNNRTFEDDDSKKVKITVNSTNWKGAKTNASSSGVATSNFTGKAKTGKSYTVESETDSSSGFITEVRITDAGKLEMPK